MQLSNIFIILTLSVASTHGALQLTADHETGTALMEACASINAPDAGLEKRACQWKTCDRCYELYPYCVGCNNGQGLSCITCMTYCEKNCC